MKHKTSELEGALLDAAVLLADGWEWDRRQDMQMRKGSALILVGEVPDHHRGWPNAGLYWSPSTDWRRGGPIIERERIGIYPPSITNGSWGADLEWHELHPSEGPTPLVAAMRAFVASKLGEEVEL